MSAGKKIKVLVVDDSESIRLSLHQFLSIFEDMSWAGESSDGRDVIEQCEALQPDVVLIDVVLPHVDVVQTTRLILQQFPHTQVIGISGFEESYNIQRLLEAGAVICLPKNANPILLAETVRKVAHR